jgi:hypothetical protein
LTGGAAGAPPAHGIGALSRLARPAGAAVVWIAYAFLHVLYRGGWLPCDAIIVGVGYTLHRRGATRARVLTVCTLVAAGLDVLAGAFLWFMVEVAIPRAFGHMFGVA